MSLENLQQFAIIDGGMGTVLYDLDKGRSSPIWTSGEMLLNNPQEIKKAHKMYIKAGSEYITTSNYTMTPYYQNLYKLETYKTFDLYEMIKLSGKIAHDAVKGTNTKVLGSLPPYSESYRADMVMSNRILKDFYTLTVKSLRDNVDGFLCETLSSIEEIEAAVTAVRDHGHGKNIWVSFVVRSNPDYNGEPTMMDGTRLKDVFKKLRKYNVKVILFNCSSIHNIRRALNFLLKMKHEFILGVYPNSEECEQKESNTTYTLATSCTEKKDVNNPQTNELDGCKSMDEQGYVELMKDWIANKNVSIVGGCCGIGPSYIKAISRFKKKMSQIQPDIKKDEPDIGLETFENDMNSIKEVTKDVAETKKQKQKQKQHKSQIKDKHANTLNEINNEQSKIKEKLKHKVRHKVESVSTPTSDFTVEVKSEKKRQRKQNKTETSS
jgi:S-methylmethionine-dependent homocysteine/selenocysteine methylase